MQSIIMNILTSVYLRRIKNSELFDSESFPKLFELYLKQIREEIFQQQIFQTKSESLQA
jgi:hypothetical protein